MSGTPAPPLDIRDALQSFDPSARKTLTALRRLIFETASETPSAAPLEETLKWGQPSYTPARPGVGSSVRLGVSTKSEGRCALFFICNTNLVARFRDCYDGELAFEDNRAILIDASGNFDPAPIKHCVAMTLTYHLNK